MHASPVNNRLTVLPIYPIGISFFVLATSFFPKKAAYQIVDSFFLNIKNEVGAQHAEPLQFLFGYHFYRGCGFVRAYSRKFQGLTRPYSSLRISKCKWGPVDRPVLPIKPITSPLSTSWPQLTLT